MIGSFRMRSLLRKKLLQIDRSAKKNVREGKHKAWKEFSKPLEDEKQEFKTYEVGCSNSFAKSLYSQE